MTSTRLFLSTGIAFAAAVVLFSAFAASATAQTPPYTAYGIGQTAGAKIAANIAGKACGEATVAAAGTWLLPIPTTAACAPKEGDTVAFTINGVAAAQTVKWTAGGAPADAAKGIALTAGAAAPAPAPAKTGDAGLLGSTGTSMALVLMMGIAAAALVAGARTATRER